MSSAAGLAKSVRIPPRPEVLVAISNEVNSETPDIDRVVCAIKKDVTLYGAILRLVNSPAIGFAGVKTIDRAIMLLGLKRIAQLAQVTVLQNQLGAAMRLNRFWDTAAEVAEITSLLASKFTGLSTEDAYTVGMFHDYGVPLMMQSFPDYKELLMEANQNPVMDLVEEETNRYGFNHYDVGFELGKIWLVPDHLNQAIRFQPQLDDMFANKIVIDDSDTVKTLLALLDMAKNISGTHRKFWRSKDETAALGVSPLALNFLDMDAADYLELRDEILHKLRDGK